MPCDPSLNVLNPGSIPLPNIGLGIAFGPPNIELPGLPDGIPEDLLDLLRKLLALIPGGPLVPNLDNFAKDIIDAIASLLNQLGPYLALWRFLQALLNMIMCILDVLCAAPNPFRMKKALKRLFKQCLPPFLNLFPWLALIAMIIALLLLLLALIEYLINQLLAILRDIIRNIQDLAGAVSFNDASRQLAAARKIAQLLCMIEQLFAILVAFQAVLAIIKALSQITGRSACGKGSGSGVDCCTDEVCPPFIFNTSGDGGIPGTTGTLFYHREVENDVTGFPGLVLPTARNESWQFYDSDVQRTYKFVDIITPIEGNTFWPEGKTYAADTTVSKAPYTLDMKISVNPAFFSLVDPIGTQRNFWIKDIIVTKRPTKYTVDFDTGRTIHNTGVLMLEGGLVYEEDQITPFDIAGEQATLNDFIHLDPIIGFPVTEDGYTFSGLQYVWKNNLEALVAENIITLGCDPDLQIEVGVVNSTIDLSSVFSRIGDLPDIGTLNADGKGGTGTLGCLASSITRIRSDVSVENVTKEQGVMVACLNDLKKQTQDSYKNALIAGTSQFSSTVEVIPDVQFVSLPIQAKVTLKDLGGNTLSGSVPIDVRDAIAQQLDATVTLGQIGSFTFDGYESFVADITSDVAGDGELRVLFDERVISIILNRGDDDTTTTIEENVQTYTFVGVPVSATDERAVRRDESDIAGNKA